MALHSVRKLFTFGRYSLALLLPKQWLTELNANDGSHVNLAFDRKRGRIVVTFDGKTVTKSTSHKQPELKTKSEKPASTDGWEPIPQL